mgnify:CR=1 FL=1
MNEMLGGRIKALRNAKISLRIFFPRSQKF